MALYLIDRGDIRWAIDRCSNIWASLPGAGYGQFEHKADSLIANSKKRAERSERLMYEQSHRDYLRLVICIIVCLSGCHHYRDNAITYKAQRDKMPENWSWRTRYWRRYVQMRLSVMLLVPDAKYTKELADAKAENDALRDDAAAGRRRLHIKKRLSVSA